MNITRALAVGVFLAVFSTDAALAENVPARAEFHHSYPLTGAGVFSIDDQSGTIRVIGWDRNSVQVDAIELAGSAADLKNISISADATAARVNVVTNFPSRSGSDVHVHSLWQLFDSNTWRFQSPSVDYIIHVPKLAKIKTTGVDADVSASGLSGSLDADTVSGDVSASDVKGATVHTESGDVKITSASGALAVSTVSGEVTFRDTRGDVAVDTTSGDVHLYTCSGKVVVTTTSGEITARALRGLARLGSTSGDISVTVNRADRLTVSASTTSGEIQSDVGFKSDAPVQVHTVSGDISVGYSSL